MSSFVADILETPLGKMLAVADDNFLYQLSFHQTTDAVLAKQAKYLSNEITRLLKKELDLYFNGLLQCFSVPIKQQIGTDFEKLAWGFLSTVPYGKLSTYKEQAIGISHPKSYRAVANANAKNKILILVPCHRVIKSNLAIGGYLGGTDKKMLLIDIEKKTSSQNAREIQKHSI